MERRSGAVPTGGVRGISGVRRRWRRAAIGLALFLIAIGIGGPAPAGETSRPSEADLKLGRELFSRQWRPNDPRCHGGDGLGPVYNATSCVACHGQGGPGGAGPARLNVEVISAIGGTIADSRGERELNLPLRGGSGAVKVQIPGIRQARGVVPGRGGGKASDAHLSTRHFHLSTSDTPGRFRHGFVVSAGGKTLKTREFDVEPSPDRRSLVLSSAEGSLTANAFALKPDEDDLVKYHPGLLTASSAVLHRFGVDPAYAEWRSHLTIALPSPHSRSDRHLGGIITGGRLVTSQRNAPPLFGLGLIDALPDEVLVATAAQQPVMVRGRVNRMTSGRIGKFGWKAQTTDLRGFVLAACANELGLEAPGHGQAVSPLKPDTRSRALDLTQEECDALAAYVQALPAPIQLDGPDDFAIKAGRASFEEIGCTDCHRPNLGNINGIYSDLLMHDMGPELTSVAMTLYYGPTVQVDIPTSSSLADGSEWRTPPLWGYRDSGPYLHDGRALNLHDVVRAHKGQALQSAMSFAQLPDRRQWQIDQFLKSLAAPPPASPADLAAPKDPSTRRRSLLGPPASPPPAQRSPAPRRADAVE
ncbi:MAG: di-heme oxidoredictase family protein [Isosphaeraceae bacterium]